MKTDGENFPKNFPSGFPDNWSYLKAELAWLDRLLMRAIAKQRQVTKEVERVARSEADRASSHWWKGFMTLEPDNGGRQVPPTPSVCVHPLGRYGDRIAQTQGIKLSIPNLCERLVLGKFERDLLVLLIAPEISRRYERLYAFLNHDEANCRQPTVDLALRLFCRSDLEWRQARTTLLPTAPLIKSKIIEISLGQTSARSLLSRSLQLTDKAVNYLISEDLPLEAVLPKPRKKRL